jgi:hypothetical protein
MYKITAVLKVETDIITCTESQRVRDTSVTGRVSIENDMLK